MVDHFHAVARVDEVEAGVDGVVKVVGQRRDHRAAGEQRHRGEGDAALPRPSENVGMDAQAPIERRRRVAEPGDLGGEDLAVDAGRDDLRDGGGRPPQRADQGEAERRSTGNVPAAADALHRPAGRQKRQDQKEDGDDTHTQLRTLVRRELHNGVKPLRNP